LDEMKRIVRGDLLKLALNGEFDVIVHGCNCGNTMGAGIALAIKREFPEAYRADCNTTEWDRSKMGTISQATVRRNGHDITVVNGYTQYHWRVAKGNTNINSNSNSNILVDYDAVRSVMKLVKIRFRGQRIGYPLIGAGLAKGDWKVIEQIIDEELKGEDHKLVQYENSP